ncbi:ribokinase [Amylibacter marinus]|uniref:ribokinase n=1 Tax=Amylibacter marinus TaxID=1475483 RepID=UPI0024E13444|nr:ribokinase [Amylibacter marinus]
MIKNFGSINIDNVYRLDRLPRAGETLVAQEFARFMGGKGLNQSVAAQRSGADVWHIGAVGPDGDWALDQMRAFGLDCSHIFRVEAPTGNAVITVDQAGENQIVILGGANQTLDQALLGDVLAGLGPQDWVVLQNETSFVHQIALAAKARGARVAYSAAPFDAHHAVPMLDMIDLLAVNEHEAAELARATGKSVADLPVDMVLITYGARGAELRQNSARLHQKSFPADVVDTTGAGDTFLGAFLARLDVTGDAEHALRYAAAAAALQVEQPGAATAIPSFDAVTEFLTRKAEA